MKGMKKCLPDLIIGVALLLFLISLSLQMAAIPKDSRIYPGILMGLSYLMTAALIIQSLIRFNSSPMAESRLKEQIKIIIPYAALILLSALYCGGVYGGSIPSVLIGIPGTPASAPTALEGRALVKKGEAGRALNLVTLASAFGGFFSSIAFFLCAPLLAKIAMLVGAPEQIFVAVFGLSVVVMLSQDNLFKGCLVAVVSLLIACFGQDPVMGFPRFTYGMSQLTGKLDVVVVLIGLFSLPEVFKMLEDPLGKMAETGKVGSMKLKLADITSNIGNVFRSTVLGVVIGIIPAAGPDIAAFLSYNEARKASKNPQEFGNGSGEGIIAAEAGNNGVTGGSLIPLLTLGIPGSAPAALFLGAMIIHGVRPGPTLFTQHADTVYTLIIGFALINLLLYFAGLAFCKCSSLILLIPKAILATSIVVLATIGTFSINKNLFNVFVMFGAGVLGYIMLLLTIFSFAFPFVKAWMQKRKRPLDRED